LKFGDKDLLAHATSIDAREIVPKSSKKKQITLSGETLDAFD